MYALIPLRYDKIPSQYMFIAETIIATVNSRFLMMGCLSTLELCPTSRELVSEFILGKFEVYINFKSC